MSNKIKIPNNIDWNHLKRFNICVQSKNFAEAALKIGTSQGGLLRQLDNLEHQLGTRLFIRTAKNRSHELTPEGKMLANIVNRMDELVVHQVVDKVAKPIPLEEVKTIRIITTYGLSTTLLAPIISDFLKEYPNTHFELIASPEPPHLSVGEIAIRHDFLPQANLKMVFLETLKSCFFASEKYLNNYKVPISYEDLTNHKLLSIKYYKRTNTDNYTFNLEKIVFLNPQIESNYISFLIEMAILNNGIVEIPDTHPASKYLQYINTLETTYVDIYASYLDIAHQDDIIYIFIKYLSNCKELINA